MRVRPYSFEAEGRYDLASALCIIGDRDREKQPVGTLTHSANVVFSVGRLGLVGTTTKLRFLFLVLLLSVYCSEGVFYLRDRATTTTHERGQLFASSPSFYLSKINGEKRGFVLKRGRSMTFWFAGMYNVGCSWGTNKSHKRILARATFVEFDFRYFFFLCRTDFFFLHFFLSKQYFTHRIASQDYFGGRLFTG